MKHEHPELGHHLVLAGARGWGVREIEKEIQRSDATGFHLIGFVAESDLNALYGLADVFVYPSLYEGFGIPPLEAMSCGTPVIVSDRSSLPEVLGDEWTGKVAGVMVDPYDVEAMASAMARVLMNRALHGKLRELGLERAREFSWERSAEVVKRAIHGVFR
jgi:glycosyltransferase involved in cell wall biosynthesis